MVEQSLVVTKKHLVVWKKIINYSNSRIDTIRDYYSEEYADVVIKLSSAICKVEENIDSQKQVIITFTLDSMNIFKEMIYMFMRDKVKELDVNDMKDITNILSRCDEWISEYMNTNNDFYVEALGYSESEKGFKRLF